jgi:RNA polymerase sigma-54 factor
LRYGRGRYAIHYDKLDALKKDPSLTPSDRQALAKLVQSMELVNARRSTMNQILESVLNHQKDFLATGKEETLKDLTQDRLAAQLGLHPSTVCRAISAKALLAPWNQELPLKDFLGRGSIHGVLAQLGRILETEESLYRAGKIKEPFRDPELAARLKKEKGITLAVRTISKYRSLAGIPNIYVRAKSYTQKLNG